LSLNVEMTPRDEYFVTEYKVHSEKSTLYNMEYKPFFFFPIGASSTGPPTGAVTSTNSGAKKI
jgi:hypothetical protein